ncbi:response regulator transcription factor [Aneurinibacillus aneurinilyticus]|uniref:response regulator transcription factor n=1 Tax=Aneurinibacillus aneurinilyticus TaxID=1391 RepID=UPI000420D685|nr:response regulator transcription factor [Aneurinibacillus aneurinilyticus]MED0707561.1 response regulator transcription factor [Aneurinibacillus aneurinilyticus]MED0723928.1 response regulator transcription factor [Aneurinibacillus aneurinilyticus]MED0735027.1 response regulator transcription factor [Aneurinibacillus aneurinilyticus]MED0739400.1 response regulator transcription factor [Aneurinibacillus aneurinilyticus]
MATILIVEDEVSINELIKRNLQSVGHTCISVFDGRAAIHELAQQEVDLVLLDIMLPEIDGYEVFQQIQGIPTIFLTARSNLSDKVKGLTLGADDYLVKPFEMLELLARVDAVLRRTKKESNNFKLDGIKIDFESRQVFLNEHPVECTPKEFDLLEVLVNNRNIALSRDRLLELAWGYDYVGDTRTVDVHIQKLRKKLDMESRIKTVYKMGYRLEV